MKRMAVLGALVLALTAFPSEANARHRPPANIRVLNADGSVKTTFTLPTANAASGFTVAATDLGIDGKPELIFGSGLGNAPEVIIARPDGSEIKRFRAYAANAGMGVNVAACDLDGDGFAEIAVSAQRGGGPHIRVFDRFGEAKDLGGFFAYHAMDRNGVNLACGNLDSDAADELVTMPATGASPLVRVWNWNDGVAERSQEFLALNADDLRGVTGVVRDHELVIASQHASEVTVRTYRFASPAHLVEDTSFDVEISGVTGLMDTPDGVLMASASGGMLLKRDGTVHATVAGVPFGAINAAAADLDADGVQEFIVADGKPAFSDDPGVKTIVVDLSEQRLYAYENGVLANTFLVSTGLSGPTPIGKHKILAKVPLVHYKGPGYDLGIIPYNLRFYPHIYIHYAPWHNNFGHRMSHGCVNVNLENIKWIYEWAEKDIPVEVRA